MGLSFEELSDTTVNDWVVAFRVRRGVNNGKLTAADLMSRLLDFDHQFILSAKGDMEIYITTPQDQTTQRRALALGVEAVWSALDHTDEGLFTVMGALMASQEDSDNLLNVTPAAMSLELGIRRIGDADVSRFVTNPDQPAS